MFKIALVAILLVTAHATLAGSDGTGPVHREQAVAMVKRVQEKFQRDGQEQTFAAIADKGTPEFHDGDLYPFVFDLNAINVVNGGRQALAGRSLASVKDQDGRYVIQEIIALALRSGGGWIEYKWPNPRTGAVEHKASYVERMGDFVVGVGVYEPLD